MTENRRAISFHGIVVNDDARRFDAYAWAEKGAHRATQYSAESRPLARRRGETAPLYAALLPLAALGLGLYSRVVLAELAARWYRAPFTAEGFA